MNRLWIGISLLAGLLGATRTFAAETAISGTAAPDSRWYEYFSDAFGQLDKGFGGNEALDGFFLISSLPNFEPIGSGGDVFPREADFDLGTIAYDDAGLTGAGAESATITGYSVDFDANIADDDVVFSIGYATTLQNVAGTLHFLDGALSSIDLTSDITFTYDISHLGGGVLNYAGTFTIDGDQFTLDVDDTQTVPGFGDFRYAWESTGTIDDLAATPATPGDTNGDGVVDLTDLNNVRNNFGSSGESIVGDTNGDQLVDLADLNNVRNNFGSVLASVPEPSAMVLVLASIATVGFARRVRGVAALLIAMIIAGTAAGASVDLRGDDHTGYLAFANVKNYGVNWPPNTDPTTDFDDVVYPYYFDTAANIWRTIAAEPLASTSIYAEESTFSVVKSDVTDADFSSTDIGDITFNDALLTGVGVETIGPGDLILTLSAADFSPLASPHNLGSGNGNWGWDYVISASNLTGSGLTYVDGKLTGIDLAADVSVLPRLAGGTIPFLDDYDGTLTFSGNQFAFDLDVTKDAPTPFGTFAGTHMVFNRAGSVAAVPEPSAIVLAAICVVAFTITLQRRASFA